MKRLPLKVLTQWILGILLLLYVLYLGNFTQLSRFPGIHPVYVVMIFLSTLGLTLSHNYRWWEILKNISSTGESRFFPLYRYLINSYGIGMVIPMDISLLGLRSYYLTQFEKMSTSMAIFSVLLDRILDLMMLFTMALPSFLWITQTVPTNQSVLVLGLLLSAQVLVILWKKGDTFLFFLKSYRSLVVHYFLKVPFLGNRLKEGMKHEVGNYDFSVGSIFKITGWNFIKYIFLCLRFYFTGQALGISFPFVQSFFFVPLVQLSGLINVTPGGFGVIEIGTYGALFFMGIPKSQALVFVLGQRVPSFPCYRFYLA